MLLLHDSRLNERRAAVAPGGPLAPLLDSLVSELEPLLDRPPYIPEQKALLSRAGGRCARDGTALEFDPWSPQRHRCARCGAEYHGELHHRWWVMSYQLWLAERALHAALFAALRGDPRHVTFARDLLREYAQVYLKYPNQDNVLGPTRLFFSTYLESIWLLQIVIASDLLAVAGDTSTRAIVRERIVEPSAAIIADFDEGLSNRQVWNNAALLASAATLGRESDLEPLIAGESGLESHLATCLLADGTWYEGDNYHQFALRGLWFGITLAEAHGREMTPALADRFHRAFAAPYLTALPDFTMPSRKDSQYAVSLRQWRVVETAELGFARAQDPLVGAALARSYENGHERRDTGRARSTADVERNGPASALTRADLGWRALLFALPELPRLEAAAPRSVVLEGQGYAVFRRPNDVYVGFECGQSGGGHGHPDRVNLTLYQGSTRWLDDLGTGSYVDPSLHWYRSTLAHNAPLVNGVSQPLADATLLAHEERDGFGWAVAEFLIPENHVRLERTVIVARDYLVDELRWTAAREVQVDLPWHLEASVAAQGRGAVLDGGANPQDGFVFVRNAMIHEQPSMVMAERDSRRLCLLTTSDGPSSRWSADAPGQPASETRRFQLLRGRGKEGCFRAAVSWSGEMHWQMEDTLTGGEKLSVSGGPGMRDVFQRIADGLRIETGEASARRTITLGGFRTRSPKPDSSRRPSRSPLAVPRIAVAPGLPGDLPASALEKFRRFDLGEMHYRRSEESWNDAGQPRATVFLAADAGKLVVVAEVNAGEPHFAPADAANPFDNEEADTMAAGVQVYLNTPEDRGAWLLVPELRVDRVRVRPIGDARLPAPTARWRRSGDGYAMRIELPLPDADEFDFDLIVNETIANRQRRRGQLVLSGAPGEFVYLRGDRHDAARFLRIRIAR